MSMTAPNCYEHPECTAYHQNKFYVSYPQAHCIKVFGKTGMYIHDIGCEGSSDGQFSYARGLVIDKYNRLIVCDGSERRLQLFTLSGKFLGTLQGEYPNNCNSPWCAASDKNGNLVVAGPFESFIVVFDKKRD